MAFNRDYVARVVKHSLGRLAQDMKYSPDDGLEQGDFTFSIDQALRDCGLTSTGISDDTSDAAQRAVILGTEYYALNRLYRDRASEVTSQQGAGAAAMHISVDYGQSLGSLRLHVDSTEERYREALAAIGRSFSKAGGDNVIDVVHLEAGEDSSDRLMDADTGLPWFREAEYGLT